MFLFPNNHHHFLHSCFDVYVLALVIIFAVEIINHFMVIVFHYDVDVVFVISLVFLWKSNVFVML